MTTKKKLGKYSKIAAGSVVFKNVKANTTVAGNPAKKIKDHKEKGIKV